MASRSKARSGTFFLREGVTTDQANFQSSSIDVSSFVNVLDGELLRVNQVWWSWQGENGGPISGAEVGVNTGASAMASLSTESRTAVGSFGNNDNMSLNRLYCHSTASKIDYITNETSVNPVDFNNGFLVATDAIHLNVDMGSDLFAGEVRVQVLMECEIVKLSLSDAQAVLVSQTIG